MIKELKYVFYFFIIFFFIFFTLKYYFSDENKKNSYRSYQSIDEKINIFTANLSTLQSDTENIIHYVENNVNKNKKTYNFWKLLTDDEK
tara:strand:+ start:2094 stop:2360 length:267 start_codon:yes stop_codon:yes gene_type:complete